MGEFPFQINDMPVSKIVIGHKYRMLLSPYHFMYNGVIWVIPEGFVWDMASIPQACSSFVMSGSDPRVELASLVHDFFYRFGLVSRKDSDIAFYELCRYCGVGSIKAKTMYRALRLFGGKPYKKWDELKQCNHIIFFEWLSDGLSVEDQEMFLQMHEQGKTNINIMRLESDIIE